MGIIPPNTDFHQPIVYSTAISVHIKNAYKRWKDAINKAHSWSLNNFMEENISLKRYSDGNKAYAKARNAAFIEFANLCENEGKTVLQVIEEI